MQIALCSKFIYLWSEVRFLCVKKIRQVQRNTILLGMYELLRLSRVRARTGDGPQKKGPFIFHCFHVELLAYLYNVHTYIHQNMRVIDILSH